MANNFLLNAIMSKAVDKIVKSPEKMFLHVEAVISSIKEDTFKFKIERFISLDIVQDFLSNYSDFIEVRFEMTPPDYIALVENYQDLICKVKLIKYDARDMKEVGLLNEISGRFILSDKEDLFKKYPVAVMMPTEKGGEWESHHSATIEVKAQIIDPVVYELRKVKINAILRDVTMNQVLHFVADQFNIGKVSITKSDNNKTYKNFVIPPMRSISDIFTFLQNGKGFGVYNKGIAYYYSNDILYVYPMYETDPAISPVVNHMYHVDKNMFEGLDCYHIMDGENTHILNNKVINMKDMAEEGYENSGNAFIIQNSELMVDYWRYMQEYRKFTVPVSNVALMTNNTKSGVTKNVYNPQFRVSDENPLIYITELYKNDLTAANTMWDHAVPFTFKPGWKIIYHYEGDGTYHTRNGVCTSVVYSIQRSARIGDKWVFGSSANINMFLSNDDKAINYTEE